MGLDQSKSNPPQNQTNSKLPEGKAFYQGECDDQGRHHGKGVMKYSDGSIFEGIFSHGMPQKGIFKYPNGNVYEGELKDNKPHGRGIWKQQKGIFEGAFENGNFKNGQVKYSDGSYYKGQMKNMKKSGQSCYYRFADGDIFVGSFSNDFFSYGQYTSKDKDLIYKGHFNNRSQKNGKGSLLLAGVAQYQGNFLNDQFDGEGTLVNLKTSVKYEGQFKRGKKNGKGKLFGPDNNLIYEGEFIENQKYGKGVFYFQNKRYEGSFVTGKFQGQGVLHYGDGDVYKGTFKNNKKHGNGELMLVKNSIQTYKGEFVQDRFEGEGEVNYSNGDIYKGGFRGNKKHGKGAYTATIDGKHKIIFEGEWVDDVKNGQFSETSTESGTVMKGPYKNGEKDGIFKVYESKRKDPVEEEWRMGKKIYKH